jgi:uracil-DNA glycosylase
MGNSTEELRSIRDDVIQCTQCDLYKTRINPVVGSGNHNADILFIGEAPEEEDKTAVPFVGSAGKVLDKMLVYIGMKREDIYITNILKCRPPNNDDPTKEQKDNCSSYLIRQVEAIKPKVVVCLGNHATKSIMNMFGLESKIESISKIHGKLFQVDPVLFPSGIKVMPLYHPAAMLHNPPLAEELRKDFKKLKAAIERT